MSTVMKLNKRKLQQLRTMRCWSQEQLAAACGISVRTIQRIEKTGQASLETTRALAAVYQLSPDDLQVAQPPIEVLTFSLICKYAWLVAFIAASIFFGLWIVDILIPTLKGADFNQQYELHHNFRYLDFGGICFAGGFLLLGLQVYLGNLSRKQLTRRRHHLEE